MYSQCPECLTRFRVTAAALRAAHGTVRCGRCGIAFDALTSLSDGLQPEPPSSSAAAAPTASLVPPALAGTADMGMDSADLQDELRDGEVVTEFHFSADDIEQVFIDARDWQRQFGSHRTPAELRLAEQDAADTDARSGRDVDAEDDASHDQDPDASRVRATGTPEDVYVHEPEAVEDITLEGERIVIEGGGPEFFDDDMRPVTPAGDEPWEGQDDAVRLDDPAGSQPAPVDLDSTDRFEVLQHVPDSQYPVLDEDDEPSSDTGAYRILEGEAHASGHTAPAPVHVEEQPEEQPAAVAGPEPEPQVAAVSAPPHVVPFRLRERASSIGDDTSDDDAETTTTGRTAALAWGIGALLLAVALVAQVTHQYREDLARNASLGPALRSLYAQLGRPLTPNWDLAAFELRQWGASEGPASSNGVMTVRASLRNGADFAQPIPLLRLELEDRFGGTVARRDFEPAEYLKDPAQASRMLAPATKTEAELVIVDAPADAVGYRLDVCLRDPDNGVRCALPSADGTAPQ